MKVFRSERGSVSAQGSVPELVLRAAAAHPERAALIDGPSGEEVTYTQLGQRVRQVAAGLRDRGLGAGDVVALLGPNCPQWAGSALGAMAAGCPVTPLNPLYTPRELDAQLRDSAARLVIAIGRSPELSGVDVAAPSELLAEPGALPALPASALAVLPYSSGTTGLPKGVRLTNANLVASVHQVQSALAFSSADRILAVAPFFHAMGLMLTLCAPLAAGATVVTMARFDLQEFLGLVEHHRITCLVIPPPLAAAIAGPGAAGPDLSSVECVAVGGAALSPAVQEALAARLPAATIGQGYGLTETTVAIATPDRAAGGSPPGTVGHLAAGTELRVVDPETGEDVGTGRQGELWARGPQVMAGYLNRPEATAEILDAEGWLRTGDIGFVDADGYVHVVDRLKELIKVNAFQVPPAELEALLLEHPAVADAAVVGLQDARCGQVPVAVVVARTAVDAEELMAWVAERVAPYKRLAEVRFTEQIPRTPSGKIMRRLLAQDEVPAVA